VDRTSFLSLAYEVDGTSPARASKLLVFLHGYGGSTSDVAWIGEELRKLGLPEDVSIVYVDGAYAGGGGRCWGNAEAELHTSVARVRALIESLSRGKQASQVYVAGFSQGAAIAQRIAMAGDVAKTGILLSGCHYARDPLPAEQSVRYLYVHGRSDSLCSHGAASSIVDDFVGRGLDAELVSFEGDHVVPQVAQLEIVRAITEPR
jgi:predicted esterase